MIEIILSSFNQLFHTFEIFLKTKDLTIGAILAGIAPFIVIWIKISKEKEKKARSMLIERRQMQIAFNVNEIMEALKVESKWSLQEIGSTHADQESSKRWLSTFMMAMQKKNLSYPRRKQIMIFLKSNISKKLFTILMGVAVTALNNKFNLQLSENDIYIMFAGIITYIVGQSHVDAKKAIANTVKAISVGVQAAVPNIEPMPDVTYAELVPTIKNVHDGINNLLKDARLNDGSQAFKDASQAYFAIIDIIQSFKQPEPLPIVQEEQVSA
jgi:hypothetical protein